VTFRVRPELVIESVSTVVRGAQLAGVQVEFTFTNVRPPGLKQTLTGDIATVPSWTLVV
jgi:hypothetical protein